MNSKRFLVTLTGDDTTRWIDGDDKIQAGLECLVRTFARSYTAGAVPSATVKLICEKGKAGTMAAGGGDARYTPPPCPVTKGPIL